jgi:hypothetical protein
VSVRDRARNDAAAAQAFSVDTRAPQVVVESPADGSTVDVATLSFEVTWSDPVASAFASGIDVAAVTVRVDGQDVAATVGPAGATGILDLTLLGDGVHVLGAEVADGPAFHILPRRRAHHVSVGRL